MTISAPKLNLFCDAWHNCFDSLPRGCGRYAHTGQHNCIRCRSQVWFDGPKPGDGDKP